MLRLALPTVILALTATSFAQKDEELPEPELSEQWEPKPPKVDTHSEIPSDAIALFDGTNLDAWEKGRADCEPWTIQNGILTVNPQKPSCDIRTKQSFGDVQLHLEFRSPAVVEEEGQGRGNSGIFFMGRYEIQILDSYQNETYANGQLGSIYKQYPPLANPARQPGEWSTYDIIFIAPRFNEDGSLKSPARMTAFINGVLVQYDSELYGKTVFRGLPAYEPHPAKLPIILQEHKDLVSYRNIWIRELDGDEIANRTVHPDLK